MSCNCKLTHSWFPSDLLPYVPALLIGLDDACGSVTASQGLTALEGLLVQVHVGWLDNGTAVFAFRGTESAQDGLQDAKFLRRGIDYLEKAYPGVKAHLGELCPPAAFTAMLEHILGSEQSINLL